jgi:hypothetical protein
MLRRLDKVRRGSVLSLLWKQCRSRPTSPSRRPHPASYARPFSAVQAQARPARPASVAVADGAVQVGPDPGQPRAVLRDGRRRRHSLQARAQPAHIVASQRACSGRHLYDHLLCRLGFPHDDAAPHRRHDAPHTLALEPGLKVLGHGTGEATLMMHTMGQVSIGRTTFCPSSVEVGGGPLAEIKGGGRRPLGLSRGRPDILATDIERVIQAVVSSTLSYQGGS